MKGCGFHQVDHVDNSGIDPPLTLEQPTHEQDHARTAPLESRPAAEAIRNSVLADQRKGRAEALARIEAAAKAPQRPKGRHSPAPAPQARAKAKRPATAPSKPSGKRAAMLASALAGKLPAPPDFAAATHARFRPKLAEVIALAKAGDVEGLAAWTPNWFIGSSTKAIMRYRDLALVALEARTATAAA